jgi:hypothetical protein
MHIQIQRHRQQGDLISLLLFYQTKGSRLKRLIFRWILVEFQHLIIIIIIRVIVCFNFLYT